MYIIDNRFHATFDNGVENDGKIYYVDWNSPTLYVVDDSVHEVCTLPENPIYGRHFSVLCIYKGNAYMASFNRTGVYKVHLENGEYVKLNMPYNEYDVEDKDYKFFTSYVYEECVYFFGGQYPGILIIDCNTDNIVLWNDWVPKAMFRNPEHKEFWARTTRVGNKIYAAMYYSNSVMVFDLESRKYTSYTVGSERCSYHAIYFDGNDFWLAPRSDGPVVKWNELSGKTAEYDDFPKGYAPGEFAINSIVPLDEGILMLPVLANMMIYVNKNNGQMSEFKPTFRNCGSIDAIDVGDSYILVLKRLEQFNKSTVYRLHKSSKTLTEFPIVYENDLLYRYSYEYLVMNNYIEKDGRVFEEKYPDTLKDYLKYIDGAPSF